MIWATCWGRPVARSDIERAADRYRRSIDARERAAIRATLRAYRMAIAAVDSRIDTLRMGLEARPEAEWRSYAIAQQEQLRDALQIELDRAAQASATAIDEQRAAAFVDARDVTRSAVLESLRAAGHAPFAAALGGQLNTRSLEAVLAQVQQRSAVMDMLRRHATRGARGAADRIVQAVALGENPRKIASGVRANLQTEAWKALRIARTEVIRAHTAGAIGAMRETPTITPSYEWAAQTSSACLACLAEHGKVYPVDTVPARHPNCKCVMLPVVIDPTTGRPLSQPIATGQDIIDRMDAAELAARFGDRRAALLAGPGRVPLADMVTVRESETWGKTVAIVPLRELAS